MNKIFAISESCFNVDLLNDFVRINVFNKLLLEPEAAEKEILNHLCGNIISLHDQEKLLLTSRGELFVLASVNLDDNDHR